MTVHLFGLLPADAAVAPPAGVRVVETAAGRAWVRDGEAPGGPERSLVLRAALAADVTPAPARAGTHFDDDDALVAALGQSADAWRAALARVRGRVEMLVFAPLAAAGDAAAGDAAASDAAASDESPGRAYMARLRRRVGIGAEGEALCRSLRAALGDCVEAESVVMHATRTGVLVSHLVPRAAAGTYVERLRDWCRAPGAARIELRGPIPPHSFAEVTP